MVRFTMDGKEIDAEEGTTILKAAEDAGIDIPHLCFDERIEPIASCRLCFVEVNGVLATSCTYRVKEGINVITKSDMIDSIRRRALELMLADHNIECIACERSGDCLLEKYAYDLKVKPAHGGKKETYNTIKNEFFSLDSNKCILCGKCISVCKEVQQCNVLEFAHRGIDTVVSTPFKREFRESNCVFCGNCLSICPTGAMVENGRAGKGREWELKKTKTVCPYCGVGCNITVHTKGSRIVKVTSSKDSPNDGWLCVKGRFGLDFVNSEERIRKPLIRENGVLREAGWDEALNYVASKLKEIKEKYGSDAIGGLSSAKCTNEENYLFQKFMRCVIGTNNVDHCARLCHSSTVAGLTSAFGSGAMTNNLRDILKAQVILVAGSNTTEAHPVYALRIKKAVRNGAKLIVADPRRIELVEYATIWLRQRFGTDVALFNGLLHVMIRENLIDADFISKRTTGFEELRRAVEKYALGYVEGITGVPKKSIVEAARLYSRAPNGAIVYAMGITQHEHGTDNVLALANLAMATGNIGKEGSGVNPLRGQNNVQGACDMGALPDVLPGYQKLTEPEVIEKFENAWQAKIPSEAGLTAVEMIHGALDGRIKALVIMGENPRLSDPDASMVDEALSKIEFFVSMDMFLNETNKHAHVILPAASFLEKDGTFTNTERCVQLVRKGFEPLEESKPDWEIICELSKRSGFEMSYSTTAGIMDEIRALTPIYGGITHERIKERGLQWPCRDLEDNGTPVLHTGADFHGKFHKVEYREPPELPDEEYPFYLTTGRVLFHFHTGTMTRRSTIANYINEPYVEMNPIDAKELGVKDRDEIYITSRRGRIKGIVKITEKVPPKSIFASFHFHEMPVNELTIAEPLDPVAKIPNYKVAAVRIEKATR
jgi:formate dehydrogenase alpha subunit